jgi:hypothetical protein
VTHRVNEICIIVGKKGCGKSTEARRIALTRPRRIYIDAMREYTDGVIVKSYLALEKYLSDKTHQNYAVILRTMRQSDVLATLRLPTGNDNPDNPPLPGSTIIVDEADKLCGPTSVPEPIDYLLNYGRHFGVSVIFIARRMKSLPLALRAGADRIIIGRTVEPSDVDAVEEYIGAELAQRVREIPEIVEGAPRILVEWTG